MQVLNYFRAIFCNSRYAVLDLVRNNKKYNSLAEKTVSVKKIKCVSGFNCFAF